MKKPCIKIALVSLFLVLISNIVNASEHQEDITSGDVHPFWYYIYDYVSFDKEPTDSELEGLRHRIKEERNKINNAELKESVAARKKKSPVDGARHQAKIKCLMSEKTVKECDGLLNRKKS